MEGLKKMADELTKKFSQALSEPPAERPLANFDDTLKRETGDAN